MQGTYPASRSTMRHSRTSSFNSRIDSKGRGVIAIAGVAIVSVWKGTITRLIGIIGIAGAVLIALALSIEKIYAAIPTIKVPGAIPMKKLCKFRHRPPTQKHRQWLPAVRGQVTTL